MARLSEQHGNNQYNKKGTQATWVNVQSVKVTFGLFKSHKSIDNSTDFNILSCHEKVHDNQGSI